MSRIAKHPIEVPKGVEAKLAGKALSVKGGKGELSLIVCDDINVEMNDGKVILTKANDTRHARSMWGTTSSLIRGMMKGVSEGYMKRMVIAGVGYRAALKGKTLVLQLGFSHDVNYEVPKGIEIKTPKPTEIEITGVDKQQVGQVAAEIFQMKPPEPFKGKGINYEGRYIRRKEGKKK